MIAVFDSGYGGLTVLKPIMELLPQYDYLYLGDNAKAPYGIHSAETIQNFSEKAVEYLLDRGVTMILFACNTTSSMALRHIQNKYLKGDKEKDKKVLGVLISVAEFAAEASKNKKIGVVGTSATVESNTYTTEIHKIDPKIVVYSKACPLLVPFIEENWHNKPEAISILKKYMREIKSANIDTLILGCTHYPLMLKHFKSIMGKRVNILTPGEITAQSLKNYLERHPEIEKKISRGGKREFLTTDSPEKFQSFTQEHFGMKIAKPTKISL